MISTEMSKTSFLKKFFLLYYISCITHRATDYYSNIDWKFTRLIYFILNIL